MLGLARLVTGAGGGHGPSLNFNFVDGSAFSPQITFTRASSATMFDSSGTLVYAPMNLLTYSEEFDNAAWVKTNVTVTANAVVAPDGTLAADKLVENTATAVHRISQNYSGTVGQVLAVSVFAKAAERSRLRIEVFRGTNACAVHFDLDTATISYNEDSRAVTPQIVDVGNGWYRCSFSFDVLATGIVTNYFYGLPGTSNSWTGDGTSGIYIWGAQLNIANMQGGVTGDLSTYYPTTSAAYQGPRLDYDPATLAARGFLIEEARTNSLPRSEDFSDASWTKSGATITADSTAAPSGTTTADTLVETTSTGQHRVYRTVSGTTNTNPYTVSFFAKADTRTRIYVGMSESPTFGRNGNAVFDLSAGTVVFTASGTGGATGGLATIQNVGNGWYRCAYTLTLGGTDTAIFTDFNLVSTGTTINYTGDGTSGLYIWGAQLEAGAFPTSYIPTTTIALTRSADVASVNTLSPWFNVVEGSFVTEWVVSALGIDNNIASLSDGTTNNRHQNYISTTTALVRTAASGVASNNNNGTAVANVIGKFAYGYGSGTTATSFNGSAVNTTTQALPSSISTLYLGQSAAGGGQKQIWLRRYTFYPRKLSNAELQSVSA